MQIYRTEKEIILNIMGEERHCIILDLCQRGGGGKDGALSGIEGKSPGKYKYRLNYYTDVLS